MCPSSTCVLASISDVARISKIEGFTSVTKNFESISFTIILYHSTAGQMAINTTFLSDVVFSTYLSISDCTWLAYLKSVIFCLLLLIRSIEVIIFLSLAPRRISTSTIGYSSSFIRSIWLTLLLLHFLLRIFIQHIQLGWYFWYKSGLWKWKTNMNLSQL